MIIHGHLLLTTKDWYNPIKYGMKRVDFRKGYRDIRIGNPVTFLEADPTGKQTGRNCTFVVTYVIHSRDFPKHFGWKGGEFTIIQFE